MELNTYLKKHRKILEEEQFADQLQIRKIYEDYSIQILLKEGYLLYFGQEDLYEEEDEDGKKISRIELSEDFKILGDLKKNDVKRVIILQIPNDLKISTTNLVIDFDQGKVSIDFYDRFRKDNFITKINNFGSELMKIDQNYFTIDFVIKNDLEDIECDYLIMPTPFSYNMEQYFKKIRLFQKSIKSNSSFNLLKDLACDYLINPSIPINQKLNFVNKKLNDSQREVVQNSINAKKFYFIHGPPGTGKSTTILSEISRQLAFKNKKILYLAPTNVAVDNLILSIRKFEKEYFEKIIDQRIR